MPHRIPRAKRAFDLVVGSTMLVILTPVLCIAALCILVTAGRPVLYVSQRRAGPGPAIPVVKFRTMRRGADQVANRDTVPVSRTRFLNLPTDSPLYTPIGRVIERTMMTEMPQLVQVLTGRLSLIGNRPLPRNVVASLGEAHPDVERRFLLPCGITGPVQLIGRDSLPDAGRLEIEIAYCEAASRSYSVLLDLRILLYTALRCVAPGIRLTPEGALALIRRHDRQPLALESRSRTAPLSIPVLGALSGRDRRTEFR